MSARNFIRLRGELADGRKVFVAADAMGCGRDKALGILCRWLLWVDAHCETADTGLCLAQVDELLGEIGAYSALSQIGWVDTQDGTVRVLEYDKYLAPTAKMRQLTAARVAACRARKRAAAAGELPAGLKRPRRAGKKGGKAGARLRKSGQAASATPRRVASEATSTRKGGKR